MLHIQNNEQKVCVGIPIADELQLPEVIIGVKHTAVLRTDAEEEVHQHSVAVSATDAKDGNGLCHTDALYHPLWAMEDGNLSILIYTSLEVKEFAIFAAVKKICRGCFVRVKLNSKPSPSQQQHTLLTRKRLLLGELEMGTVTLQNSFCLSMKREPHISDWQKNDSERILNPICYYEQKSLSSFSHDRKWPGRSSSLTAC